MTLIKLFLVKFICNDPVLKIHGCSRFQYNAIKTKKRRKNINDYWTNENLDWYWCNGRLFIKSIYYPSPIIDFVWRMLILDSNTYNEFWYELWGYYIDRVNPESDKFKIQKINFWEKYMEFADSWLK